MKLYSVIINKLYKILIIYTSIMFLRYKTPLIKLSKYLLSRPITVLIRKIPLQINPYSEIYSFLDYQIQLTNLAKNRSGYINSTTYINSNKNEKINNLTNISNWNSEENWFKWYNSSERKHIYKKFKHIIKEEHFEIVKKRVECNNDPLL